MWSPFTPPGTTIPMALSIAAAGDNTIRTPTSGKQTMLTYICLSADGANSADVVCTVKFAGGGALYIISLTAKAIWARNIGAGRFGVPGGTGNALVVNLTGNQTVYVSIEYLENKGESN